MIPDELVSLLGSPSSVQYVDEPPRRRARALSHRSQEGFDPVAGFLQVEDGRTLVQLDRRALRYATQTLLPTPRWMQVAALAAVRPVLATAERVLPRTGVACRRPDADPLAAWIDGAGSERSRGLIVRSDRNGRRFVYALGRDPRFAKLDAREGERHALESHGPGAAAAGAVVPVALDARTPALVTTLIPGRAASSAIADAVAAPAAVLGLVSDWLVRWNLATASAATVTRELLDAELFSRLDGLDGLAEYRRRLERRSRNWLGARVPLVTAHLDLTMANVLVGPHGIGVVDWAEARARALPLVDLFYAAADAAAAPDRYRDRVAPFRDGSYDRLVGDAAPRLSAALGISDDVRELCFHACWLHHAANELRAGGDAFLRIVEHVARGLTED